MGNLGQVKANRDSHGIGLRGPLIPHSAPNYENSAQTFDRLMSEAMLDLEIRLGDVLSNIEISLEEIPNLRDLTLAEGIVPLGRTEIGNPNRVVIYTRPIELRTKDIPELDRKIRDVLAELIGVLIGLRPIDIDPDYAGRN